jgi:mRNA interferase RelE/StbE
VAFSVVLHPKANRFLEKLNEDLQERIRVGLRTLRDSPHEKGVRLVKSCFFRTRIGDYRAIYEIWEKDEKVVVLFIEHRSKVYDDFERLL